VFLSGLFLLPSSPAAFSTLPVRFKALSKDGASSRFLSFRFYISFAIPFLLTLFVAAEAAMLLR